MEVGSLAEWVGAVGSLMAVAAALLLGAFDRAEAVRSRRDLHDVRQAALADGRAVANSLSSMLYDAIHDLRKLAEVVGRSEAITRNTELHAGECGKSIAKMRCFYFQCRGPTSTCVC